ncbi:MAG: ATP-binding protein [Spirochaetales bacterium]|nr:ATP-binding protein [Spirochaetales bacterium]
MKFVNREEELDFLDKKWNQKGAQLIILYGKRRVGKTELSLKFCMDKPHIYYLSEMITPQKQVLKFSESIAAYYQDEFIPESGFRDWEQAFKYISARNEKLLVIIDEFPYLAETDPSIPTAFQKIWDLHLKSSSVFLILLGSSISMMEKTVLHHKAPLYGRRTGQLLVKPFSFKSVKTMFPEKSLEETVSIYSSVGGTPLYLNQFAGKNYINSVKNSIFTKGEPLYAEVDFLLREELKEPRNYFVILEAISLGKHKLSEIINESGLEKGTVSRYLSILDSLHITEKKIPVTEKIPEKSRKGLYVFSDNFFAFWFRFVFRNRSLLEQGRINDVLGMLKENLPVLNGTAYEKIARETIKSFNSYNPSFPEFAEVGGWWDRNEEIDVVGINRKTNAIIFGEAKWSKKPMGTDIYRKLREKAEHVEWGKERRSEYFCLFSKSGFTKQMMELAKPDNVFLFEGDILIGDK